VVNFLDVGTRYGLNLSRTNGRVDLPLNEPAVLPLTGWLLKNLSVLDDKLLPELNHRHCLSSLFSLEARVTALGNSCQPRSRNCTSLIDRDSAIPTNDRSSLPTVARSVEDHECLSATRPDAAGKPAQISVVHEVLAGARLQSVHELLGYTDF
jgi:hypothetical protein